MNRRTRGFTLIEIIVAILIGTILTTIAVRSFGNTSSQLAVRQARNVFNGMAARVRAQAIESGQRTLLITSAAGDSVMIWADGRIVETVRFNEELGVDIVASEPTIRLCMSPRGYANTDCNSFATTVKISFVQGTETESLEILPLGQIRW